MRRLSLSSLAVLSLLSLSSPVLAESPPEVEVSTVGATVEGFDATGNVASTSTPSVAPVAVLQAPAPGEAMALEQLVPLLVALAESGQWGALALALALGALLVLTTVSGVRTFLGRLVPWLLTDKAGVVLSALVGPLGSLVASLASGVPVSVSLVLGFLSSLVASGLHSWRRKVSASSSSPYCKPEDIAAGRC